MPSEHGGWGLTLEPVLLGLLVEPSSAGALLGGAAFVAFLMRTPLKTALVDRRRGRWLERSTLATRVVGAELAVFVVLAGPAFVIGDRLFLLPVAVAAPLVAMELWFDVRSRSRRLAPELAGAIGMGAVAAIVALAGGAEVALAAALWLVLAARALTAIPHVRRNVAMLHGRAGPRRVVLVGDLGALVVAGAAVIADSAATVGAVAVAAVVGVQHAWDRRPIPPAKIIGFRQMALGLAVVAATAMGVWLA